MIAVGVPSLHSRGLIFNTVTQESYMAFHLLVLTVMLIFGVTVVLIGRKLDTAEKRRRMRLFLIIVTVALRAIRYPIDATVDVFTWDALFSLHVCHINLVLLVICLLKPGDFLFNYVFLIGIPMGLASGIFPGDITTDAPFLMLRGGLFVITHLLMVIAAIYLAIVEHMRPTWRRLKQLYLIATVQVALTYVVNRLLGTNFLYIMTPVPGTPIQTLSDWLGWPGYALAMVVIAYFQMLVTMLVSVGIEAIVKRART